MQRRFTVRGEAGGVTVVDDYGHHPAEVRATLAGARRAFGRRVVVAFQPHRYTRTRDLMAEFATAFNDADVLFVTGVYAAGEEPIAGVTRRDAGGGDPRLRPPRRDATCRARGAGAALARERIREGDIVLTLGAGDITEAGPELLGLLGSPGEAMSAWRRRDRPPRPAAKLARDAPLAPRTAVRVGGPADLLVRPADPDALGELLRAARALGVPLSILGGGANLLVADAGVRGVVLKLPQDFPGESGAGDALVLCAGAPIARLPARAHARGLVGMEFLGGVPGTLGGAVAMNAGTRLGEMKDLLTRVELATADGTGFVPAAALGFSYRTPAAGGRGGHPARGGAPARGRGRQRGGHARGPRAAAADAAARPAHLRLDLHQPARRLRGAAHRGGGAEGPPERERRLVAGPRQLRHQPGRRHRPGRARAPRAGPGAGGGAVRDPGQREQRAARPARWRRPGW